eukprot:9470233-Pyramimonas_sp.AAC.2
MRRSWSALGRAPFCRMPSRTPKSDVPAARSERPNRSAPPYRDNAQTVNSRRYPHSAALALSTPPGWNGDQGVVQTQVSRQTALPVCAPLVNGPCVAPPHVHQEHPPQRCSDEPCHWSEIKRMQRVHSQGGRWARSKRCDVLKASNVQQRKARFQTITREQRHPANVARANDRAPTPTTTLHPLEIGNQRVTICIACQGDTYLTVPTR